jgi:hypothetical protein
MATGGNNYSVLLKALLDTSGVQAQIDAVAKNKVINIKVNTNQTDVEKLDVTYSKLKSQLDSLKIKNASAFKGESIQNSSNAMEILAKAYRNGDMSLGRYQTALGQFKNKLSAANEEIRSTTSHTDDFTKVVQNNIKKVAQWAIATTAIYGTLRAIQEGIQYIKDLNTEMTNIGLVTGQTTQELSGMATEFNIMAKSLGTTTLEVAKGATEWINFMVHYKFF